MTREPHVLVIPSEEFLPERAPLAGIFQGHQIDAMRAENVARFGVLSVRLRHSPGMYLKTAALRALGRRVANDLDDLSPGAILRLAARRLLTPSSFISDENDRGFPVIRTEGLYWTPPSPRTDPRWWVQAGERAFRAYVKAHGKPDLIHAHNAVSAGLLAEKLFRRYGIPYVLTEHSSFYHQGLIPPTLYGAIRQAMKGAKRHLTVSDALRRSLIASLGPDAALGETLPNVLPPGFEDTQPAPAARPEHNHTHAPVLLCVASLLPIKGHATLLDAFAALKRDGSGATLRLVGDGPLETTLRDAVAALGVTDSVTFLGLLSPQAVRAEMAAADMLVIASRFETFGVVAIEALAMGLPVVSTRCGGPEDVLASLPLPDGAAAITDVDDGAALASALGQMIERRHLIDRRALRGATIAKFGRKAFSRQMRALYDSAIRG